MRQLFQSLYFFLNKIHRKLSRPQRVSGTKIISVGNLSMGGTGKTPTVIYLAEELSRDHRIAVVSRGYRGSASAQGCIVSDGEKILCSPEDSGDEAFLIASRLPHIIVAVGKDRLAIARRLIKEYSIDIILLDDGFQHYRISRDIDVVLLDAFDPFLQKKRLFAGTCL